MADSLKTGPGAVYRERRHISAGREFSQWFTADWGLLTGVENKINAVRVGNAWQSSNKAIRTSSLHRPVVTSWQRVTCEWHMLVLAGLCPGDRCLSPRAGRNTSWEGWGCREDGQGLAYLWSLNKHSFYLSEQSGSGPVLLNTS